MQFIQSFVIIISKELEMGPRSIIQKHLFKQSLIFYMSDLKALTSNKSFFFCKYTYIRINRPKTKADQQFGKGFILDGRSLFQIIKNFFQQATIVRKDGIYKTYKLLNINLFIYIPIKKCNLYIHSIYSIFLL